MTDTGLNAVAHSAKRSASAATFVNPVALPGRLGRKILRTEITSFPARGVPPHWHDCGQLVYSGIQTVSAKTIEGCWVVPPSRALWIPTGVVHQVFCRSERQMAIVYIRTTATGRRWGATCTISVTALLRELIRYAGRDRFFRAGLRHQTTVARMILEEIEQAERYSIAPRMPTDKRARAAAELVLASPGEHVSTRELGQMIGASERTLQRHFVTETGLSLRTWRAMVQLQKAVELLEAGMTIKAASLNLGYNDTGSFIRLFKRLLGATPTKWRHRCGHTLEHRENARIR